MNDYFCLKTDVTFIYRFNLVNVSTIVIQKQL